MFVNTIIAENFQDYYKPHMLVAMPNCDFKCWREYNEKHPCENFCSNLYIAKEKQTSISNQDLIEKYYINNTITKAVVFGGLEPLDSYDEVYEFVKVFRDNYHIEDDVVIYTGYNENEVSRKVESFKIFGNIIIKYGRFVPNSTPRYDEVLKITLASDNQYAVRI